MAAPDGQPAAGKKYRSLPLRSSLPRSISPRRAAPALWRLAERLPCPPWPLGHASKTYSAADSAGLGLRNAPALAARAEPRFWAFEEHWEARGVR